MEAFKIFQFNPGKCSKNSLTNTELRNFLQTPSHSPSNLPWKHEHQKWYRDTFCSFFVCKSNETFTKCYAFKVDKRKDKRPVYNSFWAFWKVWFTGNPISVSITHSLTVLCSPPWGQAAPWGLHWGDLQLPHSHCGWRQRMACGGNDAAPLLSPHSCAHPTRVQDTQTVKCESQVVLNEENGTMIWKPNENHFCN